MTNRKDVKLILKELEKRSNELHMVEETYMGSKADAVFIDIEYGEFKAKPYSVIRGASHPERAKQNRIKTNIAKYGGPSPFSSSATHQKAETTMKSKYGVSKPLQLDEFKNKFKNTSIKKYGVDHPFQSDSIKNKIAMTLINNYGVDNYFKTLTKYSVDGKSINQMCLEKGVPKCYALSLCKINGIDAALEYIQQYSESRSDIEVKFLTLMPEAEFLNCRPNSDIPFKVDFKIGSNTYIEVDGLYWHSESRQSNKRYHFDKRIMFENNNLRLFQFRADEINFKSSIVRSIINNNIDLSERIFARKTEIRVVKNKEASDFLTKNHLMGKIKAKHLGLFYNNELVSIMSYSIGKVLKIERFCCKTNTTVVGGFEKLISRLPINIDCHYWVDLRYGNGLHLLDKGFKHSHDVLGWKWTDFINTFNRQYCKANMDERKLSERQYALEMGLVKIYDAGQRLYVRTGI